MLRDASLHLYEALNGGPKVEFKKVQCHPVEFKKWSCPMQVTNSLNPLSPVTKAYAQRSMVSVD